MTVSYVTAVILDFTKSLAIGTGVFALIVAVIVWSERLEAWMCRHFGRPKPINAKLAAVLGIAALVAFAWAIGESIRRP